MTYNEELNKLSPEERELALKILKEYQEKGKSELFEDLKYQDFEEIPVDIETFLHDPKYLGKGLIDQEGKFTVFPYWVETLKKIFPDNLTTAYNTLILTGPIGIGKSLVAVLSLAYLLHRMLCLKDPYLYYGLQPIDKISFSLLNCTIDAAKGVAWDKLQQLLQSSEWFMSKGSLNKSRTAPAWTPSKRIELIFGSNNNHVIGRALFANFTDEANFGTGNNVERLKAKQRKMVSQIDARMQSRFMKGSYLPTLNIIASSKDSEQSFMESYIEMKKTNDSKTTLIIDEPQWVIRTDKGSPEDPGSFYVAVGNKFLPSELLPKNATEEMIDEYRRKGHSLLKVPAGYYEQFLDNIYTALTDIAGISTIDSMKYLSGVRINEIKTKDYENPMTREVLEVGNAAEDITQYYDFFDISKVNAVWKSQPLFIHLDMSLSGDRTGIAGIWIAGKKPQKEGEPASKELFYRLAFDFAVKAPKGYQVSFEKNRNFIRWLKQQGFSIKGISSDTYQSAQIQQELKKDGFNTSIISVDRVEAGSHICLPYQYLQSAIYEKRLVLYDKCDVLTDEFIGLERLASGKIEHPNQGRMGSKDISDAVCGALYNASQNAEKYAYEYGESLDALLATSSSTPTIEQQHKQIVEAFEDEIKEMLRTPPPTPKPIEQNKTTNQHKQNTQWHEDGFGPDFGMGRAKPIHDLPIKDGILTW